METREWKIVGPWAAFLFYLAIALEVVVMVTPFTVYFYSIYAPILNWLESDPSTAWLTAFFLPHISYTGDPVLTVLAYLGPILFALGLVIFFVCAYQVYSAKLLKRGALAVMKHLGEMYALKPLRQLRDGRTAADRRIIFTEALGSNGETVLPRRALDVDVLRYPLFIAELKGTDVALAMEVPRRHAWGSVPVPAF